MLFLNQALATAPEVLSLEARQSAESLVVLEILNTCHGMCGAPREWRFRLFEDATAEYLVSKSSASDPGKDDIILKRSTHLTKGEYDQFINLAESPQFLGSAASYNSKVPFIDFYLDTIVTYKKKGMLKRIYLRNYLPGSTRSADDPPDEVRRLVQRANELSDRIGESNK